MPITATGAVTMVATDLGLFLIKDQGFELKEHAPGWTIAEIQDLTEAQLSVATDLKEFQLRD